MLLVRYCEESANDMHRGGDLPPRRNFAQQQRRCGHISAFSTIPVAVLATNGSLEKMDGCLVCYKASGKLVLW